MAPHAGRRIAIVGSGITGLGCAWLLHRNGDSVTLYESESRCGGHTLTLPAGPYPVDLGFQVYNLTTYPNLVGFLDALGVDTEPSDMSFSLSLDGGALEWASHDLSTIFVQRRNLFSPSFLTMIWDVVRFGREAPRVLEPAASHLYSSMTLGQYLERHRYSTAFRDNYVLPMCAAVWSVPNATVLAFPVQMLVRFWLNHHLLDLVQRPCWRVVKGRSQAYVQRVLQELPDVRTSTPVARVSRLPGGRVRVTTASGKSEDYDAVVLATHSDVSLSLLGDGASAEEAAVMRGVPYGANAVYLHTDESLMPVDKRAWASWNFLGASGAGSGPAASAAVTVSYWLNRLQHLPADAPQLFVTLNPPTPPAPAKTLRELTLHHPVYSFDSVRAQAALPDVQGVGGVYFAGAWAGYGFHEDGLRAGVDVARRLGAVIPWGAGISTSPKMGPLAMLWLAVFDRFARASLSIGVLRLILPNGEERHYGGGPDSASAPMPEGEEWRGLPARRATVRVLNMDFFRKVVQRTDVGLGEAYMEGDFIVDDLGGLMALMVANARNMEGQKGLLGWAAWLNEKLLAAAHARRSNTRAGSRRNIEEHYDAGNAMYATFLDASMTYSCGIHSKEDAGDLGAAQMAKLDAVIAAAGLQPGDNVLEIGCGWGSFAMRAAATTGCRVTGLTLSKEQLAEATARVAAAGLSDRVTLLYCDYRDCPGLGTYDKVVSIEMIEAVGHEHLVSYFSTIGAALKPGGRAIIQVIAQPDERYERYCAGSDFIREHIFPGGHLPSMGAMVEAARGTGLAVTAVRDIGPDYAITLRAWRAAWRARKADVLSLGYSEVFWLKYDFYFAFCEAAFDARYIHDFHVTWDKQAEPDSSADTSAGGNAAAAAATRLHGWARQELPSDGATQALLALYFFLAGLIVSRQPLLWLMPITSSCCAAAYAVLAAAGSALLRAAPGAQERGGLLAAAVVRAVWSATAAGAAITLAARHAHVLVHRLLPMPAVAAISAATAAAVPKMPPAFLSAAAAVATATASVPTASAHAALLADSRALAATAAGYYAFRLWLLARGRTGQRGLASVLSLLVATLLLVAFSVAAYRGGGGVLLAAALLLEAPGAPGGVGEALDLLAPSASGVRALLLATERMAFVLLRVLPQLALTVLALLAPEPFSDSAGSQVAALCTLCGCHVLSVLHARRLFGQYSAATTKAAAAGGPAAGAACAAAIAAVAAGPSGSATLVKKDV